MHIVLKEQKRTPSNDEKKIRKIKPSIFLKKERDAIMMERMVNDYQKGTIYGKTCRSRFLKVQLLV